MPTLIGGNTNACVTVIGARAAEQILADAARDARSNAPSDAALAACARGVLSCKRECSGDTCECQVDAGNRNSFHRPPGPALARGATGPRALQVTGRRHRATIRPTV